MSIDFVENYENMSDEVEVVIIATGFNDAQNGFGADLQNSASHQANILAQKIDNAYANKGDGMFNAAYAQEPEPFMAQPAQPIYNGQPVYNAQPYSTAQVETPTYPQTVPPVQPVQPIQAQPVNVAPFEPDDPIPDSKPEESTEKRTRPRFVDFFMKKNSSDKK